MAIHWQIRFQPLRETVAQYTINIYDASYSGAAVPLRGAAQPITTQEDDDEDSFDNATTEKQKQLLRVLYAIPGPILLTAVFLLWGFLFDGWSVAWTVYLLVPVFNSVLACFRTRRVSPFAFPVFITFVYCLIGTQWGLWHPCWILFFSIPVFYPIAEAIDGNNKHKNANAVKETAEESHEDSENTGKTEE